MTLNRLLECKVCRIKLVSKYRGIQYVCRECVSKLASNRREQIKRKVLTHYSSFPPVCIRCGYTDIRALSIDHINGGGNQERKALFGSIHSGGRNFYAWLIENHYPDGYQVLCMNCQWLKRVENKEHRYHTSTPKVSRLQNLMH